MMNIQPQKNENQDVKQQQHLRQSSLSYLPLFSESIVDNHHISQSTNLITQKQSSMDYIQFPQSPKKKLRQRLKGEDYAKITSTYMKRGTLDSDQLDSKKEQPHLTEKGFILYEILMRNAVDITHEEESNMAIYILRKVARNNLEIQFLKKVIQNIPIFQKNPDLSKNCSSQILMKISHQFYKKNHVIFNYGSVYCLIPNGDYKNNGVDSSNSIDDQPKQNKHQHNESKEQEGTQRQQKQQKPLNKRLIIGGVGRGIHTNLKRQKSQENDLHEFDLQSGAYEPPKSPLKRNKLILKPNRSQSFSDDEDDSIMTQKEKEQNKITIQSNYPDFDIIKELKQGQSFGEIAILTGEKRTATMICSEDTHLLALSKRGFETILGHYKQFIMTETVEFLKRFPFLKTIPDSQLLSLFQFMKEERYSSGNTIFSEREPCNNIYFIKSGEIEISTQIKTEQSDDEYQESTEYNKIQSKSDIDKVKYLNLSKKRIKQRVRLYQLGAFSYFGAQEIMKKLPYRETQAKCISGEAVVFSLDKKIFKREIQIKMDWEEERDKKLKNKAQLNRLLHPSNTISSKMFKKESNIIRHQDTLGNQFTSKEFDSNYSSQNSSQGGVATLINATHSKQRKSYDFTQSSLSRIDYNNNQPLNEYFNQASLKQGQNSNSTSRYNHVEQHKSEQLINQFEAATSKVKGKLPQLQSNFIEIVQQKNQRSNSLNHLITRQNKPIFETLTTLKTHGFDITQLSKLSFEELKDLTRKVHKNIQQLSTTSRTKWKQSLRDNQFDTQQQLQQQHFQQQQQQQQQQQFQQQQQIQQQQSFQQQWQQQLKQKDNSIEPLQSFQQYNSQKESNYSSLRNETNIEQQNNHTPDRNNQDDNSLSQATSLQSTTNIKQNTSTPNNQTNKSKVSSTLKNNHGLTQASSKQISLIIRKSFDCGSGRYPTENMISSVRQQHDQMNTNKNEELQQQQRDTPPKTSHYITELASSRKDITPHLPSNLSYSIFNKANTNTSEQFQIFQKMKDTHSVFKGSTVHGQLNDHQKGVHYKFEEELQQRNQKQNNESKYNNNYFQKDKAVIQNIQLYNKRDKNQNKEIVQHQQSQQQRLSLIENTNPQFSLNISQSTFNINLNAKSCKSPRNNDKI